MQCDAFEAGRCRSCSWLNLPPGEQLARKTRQLHQLLDPFQPQQWLVPQTGPDSGFRNKAKMVALGHAHAPILGIPGPDGEPVSLCRCPLYPEAMQQVLVRIERWIAQAGLPPYRVDKKRGELKFVLLTRSEYSGHYLLRFVLRSHDSIERIRTALPLLLADCPEISVVSVNIQPHHMAVLEGEEEIFLTEQVRIEERFNGVPLYIRPKSFFQTHPTLAAALYARAAAWTEELAPTEIWDLFCGVGGFGLHCARSESGVPRALTGIEIEAEAIRCAGDSALAIGLENVSFRALDSTCFAEDQQRAPELVIVNPPRRGLGEALCRQLTDFAPPHILYSSCNASTLAQDLGGLQGYRLARVQLFDLFPHTPHYEVLVLLTRQAAVEA